jgi:hypothetical protein
VRLPRYLPVLWIRNFLPWIRSGSDFSKVLDTEPDPTLKIMKLILFGCFIKLMFTSSFGSGSGFETSSYKSGSGKLFRILTDPDPQH